MHLGNCYMEYHTKQNYKDQCLRNYPRKDTLNIKILKVLCVN